MKLYREINTSAGPVVDTNYTRALFEATLKYLQPPTEKQTLTGAGTVDLDKLHTWLSAASGTYAVTLPNGTVEHEEHWIFFTAAGSTATFNVSGTFRNWTTLTFDANGTSALLKWVNGKWDFVMGTARPA